MAPFRCNRPFLLESQEDWIKCSLINKKEVSANLLDPPGDAISVEFPHHIQGLQHHQRQRSRFYVLFRFHKFGAVALTFWLPTGASHSSTGKATEPVTGTNRSDSPLPWQFQVTILSTGRCLPSGVVE